MTPLSTVAILGSLDFHSIVRAPKSFTVSVAGSDVYTSKDSWERYGCNASTLITQVTDALSLVAVSVAIPACFA